MFMFLTLSTALNLVRQNSFPKLANFQSHFTQLCTFAGEATFEKHADPEKKNRNSRKSRANSRKLLEPFLRSRKEKNLYGHYAMNRARRILWKGSTSLRGCWFWSKKVLFRKNLDENFNAVERVTDTTKTEFLHILVRTHLLVLTCQHSCMLLVIIDQIY